MANATSTPSPFLNDSVDSVTFACVLNGTILLCSLVAFEIFLSRLSTRVIAAPLLRAQEGTATRFQRLPFGWAREAYARRNELDIDGAALVRFCKLGFRFSVVGSVVSCVLIPIFRAGHGEAVGFNQFGLSNLAAESPNFKFVVVAAYLLTAVFAHQALGEWHRFAAMRHEHFKKAARGDFGAAAAQAQRSVIVEDIPEFYRSSSSMTAFFERIFGPDSVHSCLIQEDTAAAHQVFALRMTTSRCCCMRRTTPALERIAGRVVVGVHGARIMTQEALTGGLLERGNAAGAANDVRHVDEEAPTQESGFAAGAVGAVRGVASGAVRGLDRVGQDVLDRALQAARMVTDATIGGGSVSTGFVTFNRVADRVVAEQTVLSRSEGWRVRAVPEAHNIVWKNVTTTLSQLHIRQLLSGLLCVLGIVWWAVPVAFVQTVSSASSLEHWLPFVSRVREEAPLSYTVITGYLPVLALMGLLKLLPITFQWLSSGYEKLKLQPDIQGVVLRRNLNYQLATLYVTVLSSSIVDSLAIIIDEGPNAALAELRRQIPEVSVYFITFVLARAGMSLPLLLLQMPTSLVSYVCGGNGDLVHCNFASEAADVALVLVLGLTYSVIAPAIMPACALYFGLAVLVYTYLFLYVYTPDVDCAGALWYDLFQASTVGLILGTSVLTSLAGINQGPSSPEFILMVPLPVFCVAFLMYCNNTLAPSSRYLTLEEAVTVDRSYGVDRLVTETLQSMREDYYLDPILLGRDQAPSDVDEIPRDVSLQIVPGVSEHAAEVDRPGA